MKGIFIPGMEMPKDCTDCPCSYWTEGAYCDYCQLTNESREIAEYWNSGKRPDWCPLQEVELPDSETVTFLVDYYDKVETHENCTVEVLTNTKTGAVSVGWWRNEND